MASRTAANALQGQQEAPGARVARPLLYHDTAIRDSYLHRHAQRNARRLLRVAPDLLPL